MPVASNTGLPSSPSRPLFACGDGFEILRRALRLEVAHHLLDFLVGAERAVHAADAAAARHVEHVALAEQLLGALLAQDGAAVDLRGDLEGDAGREVRLDGAGDDVDRRTLGGEDHVDAGGARHLREALHRAFDVLAGDHHQVGHLVDDDDDVGQRLEVELFFLVDRLAGLLVVAGVDRAGAASRPCALASTTRAVVAVDVAHAELRPSSCSALPSRAPPISARPPPSSGR